MLFRRTDKYGYSRYYGNGGPALVVKIILTVLAVAVIVLGGATIGLQKYMVYTENGGHLELPWHFNTGDKVPAGDTSDADQADKSAADESLPIVVDEDEPAADVSEAKPEEKPEQKPAAEPLVGDLLIQHVSIGDVTGGHAKGTLKDKKANGIMLFVKESGGALNYGSKLAMSGRLNASVGADKGKKIAEVIKDLKKDKYYTLAYLNGFDDAKLSAQDGFALTIDGKAVTNEGGVGWVDPANQEAQQYLADVVADMAGIGYDEVVLYEACYPFGKGAKAVDGAEDTITAFYAKLAQVAKEKKITVSVVADANVILGKDSTSGQTLDSLKALGGHVWVMKDQAEDTKALEKALEDAGFPDNTLGIVDTKLKSGSGSNYLNQD